MEYIKYSMMIAIFFLLSFVNILFAEKYIGFSGPDDFWEASRVDMGAENICHWTSNQIDWYMNSWGAGDGITFAQTKNALENAFESWENVTTSNITFEFIDHAYDLTWGSSDENLIMWSADDDDLYHTYPTYPVAGPFADPNVLAVTIITVNADEEISDVDIVFNGRDYDWVIQNNNASDIQRTATHEIGHMLGLHHVDASYPYPVMHQFYYTRDLLDDDRVGVSYLCGGNLIENETFPNETHLKWDITVAEDKTLTIESGSTIMLYDDVTLKVDGCLDAQGSSSNFILFTSGYSSPSTDQYWHSINLDEGSSSNSILEYCTIEYGTYGIYINQSIPTIENNDIDNCIYPIYVYKSNYVTGHPSILSNTISGNGSGYGIYLYESSPDIRGNDISNLNTGIYCKASSSPILGSGSVQGANDFNNNYRGLKAYIDCYPFLGKGTSGGSNTFATNHTYYINASKYCEVDAENNWWGTDDPPSTKFNTSQHSEIDYTPFLDDPPFYKMASKNNQNDISLSGSENSGNPSLIIKDYSGTISDQLDKAIHLYLNDEYPQSWEICMEIIDSSPDLKLALRTQNLLWQIAGKGKEISGYEFIDFADFLKNQVKNNENNEFIGYSKVILYGFEEDENVRMKMLDDVIREHADSFSGEAALFNKMMYYYHEESNLLEFEKLLDDLKLKYSESELIEDASLLLNIASGNTWEEELITENILPEKFEISKSYPNPFNPSTSINYKIVNISDVTVRIFNVLGQTEKNFTITAQSPGTYNITWDGTNNFGVQVPSGVYFIRFEAISLEGIREEFLKSLKVTLLR